MNLLQRPLQGSERQTQQYNCPSVGVSRHVGVSLHGRPSIFFPKKGNETEAFHSTQVKCVFKTFLTPYFLCNTYNNKNKWDFFLKALYRYQGV